MNKKKLITAALPYANGALHLGHFAGAYLPADIYVRYSRLCGEKVTFISGSDEHGTAIEIRAKKEGKTPQEIVDKYHKINKDTFEKLGISFDFYGRTTASNHRRLSQSTFKILLIKGLLTLKETEQYYDEEYNQFLADRFVSGVCPKCTFPAHGNQCEECGIELSPTDLINPVSKLSGNKPTLKKTSHYYFNLPKFKTFLEEYLESHPEWKSFTLSQSKALLKTLQDRPITRDLDWGIKVPLLEMKDKVLYVWFEALLGYITFSLQENAHENLWKDDSCEIYNFIGKDNIVFHSIFFPALLKAIECNLPTNVVANQFLNFKGRKFSKSKRHTIEPHKFLEEYKEHPNAVDVLRFTLARKLPENGDSNFSVSDYDRHYNRELVDNFGNLVHRVTSLIHKYHGGEIRRYHAGGVFIHPNSVNAVGFHGGLNLLCGLIKGYMIQLDSFSPKKALEIALLISSETNKLIQENKPWEMYKNDPNSPHLLSLLSYCINTIGVLSVLFNPFIPESSAKLRRILNLPPIQDGDLLKVHQTIAEGGELFILFQKLGESEILFQKFNTENENN